MRFDVDPWDPGYGTALDPDLVLAETAASVNLDVEVPAARWSAVVRPQVPAPSTVLFVDGVRRIDAHVWVRDGEARGGGNGGGGYGGGGGFGATEGICASYAAGVVASAGQTARLSATEVRRGLFTSAGNATGVTTRTAQYPLRAAAPDGASDVLSLALQGQLAAVEDTAARHARVVIGESDDLLVVDGPLHGRGDLPRTVGLVKTHRATYLPGPLHTLVASLRAAERTPVFLIGTSWQRYSWYLRLPCPVGAPWAGVVRCEASGETAVEAVLGLATRTQVVLPRFASCEYKDARAPQNLYPIAGLERELRRRLGDQALLYRGLRAASVAS